MLFDYPQGALSISHELKKIGAADCYVSHDETVGGDFGYVVYEHGYISPVQLF